MKTSLPITKWLTILAFSCLLFSLQPSTVIAQGTAFSYQGRLNDNGSPANGIYDVCFRVFDAPTNGNLVAGPLTNSAIGVANGLFAVTLDLGGGVFTGPNRWLEIGVRTNGGGVFTPLLPRQPMLPMPYAIYSANAGNATTATNAGSATSAVTAVTANNFSGSLAGDVTGTQSATVVANVGDQSAANVAIGASAANAATSAGTPNTIVKRDSSGSFAGNGAGLTNLNGGAVAAGTITSANLAAGAAAGNLSFSGQSGVASGGLVLSATDNAALLNAGYVKIGSTIMTDDAWQQRVNASVNVSLSLNEAPPAGRASHTAVWTGSEMIVWGGVFNDGADHYLNDGGRYNPAANSWTAVSITNAPAARSGYTAVWTGSEMIIWGGSYHDGTFHNMNDGARYSPAGNSWTAVTTNGAPAARSGHTAVWTGSEMIIWGGSYYDGTFHNMNDGARYNPSGNSWTAVTTNGVPSARSSHTAVWTGSEMVVWGGSRGGGVLLNDGARYNPAGNSWTGMTTNGAPPNRYLHTAVWTGSEMIVWGGWDSDGSIVNSGGRYNPAGNSWTSVSTNGAPAARLYHTAAWTGSEMIVWGGSGYIAPCFNDGGRYNPMADSWTEVSITDAPSPRLAHSAVWTGTEMIVWGGLNNSTFWNDGGRYNSAANSWTTVSTNSAPAARYGHTAVWTGSELIVWGGYSTGGTIHYLNDGGRYDPARNSWTAVSTSGAPSARYGHTAVWTGSEMIVWGGLGRLGGGSYGYLNTGGRYNPAGDSWAAVATTDAPGPSRDHTAVWTGSEMIVWGGYDGGYINQGGRYNPATNSWTTVSTTGAPSRRSGHTAVWTSSEMIIWGGYYFDGTPHYFDDGARYNPVGNSWTAVSTAGAPAERVNHTAVWTGSAMIVWGGTQDYNGAYNFNDGGCYNPTLNSWTAVNTVGAPAARFNHTAVWTGSEMSVWGGTQDYNLTNNFSDGGRYNPAGNSWTAVSTNGAPAARYGHTAVWTGSEMIVWGGLGGGSDLNDGGRYNPATNSWTVAVTPGVPSPSARSGHTAVWTGSEMIVWGGYGGGFLNDGGRYYPAANSWTPVTTNGAPAARYGHTAVWTGSEIIVWGGVNRVGDYLNDGRCYNPAMNSWTAVTTTGAPAARYLHTAVWTDSEMIIWGGLGDGGTLNDGGRYNPTANSWTAVTGTGAAAARRAHTAVWTGSEMIVWGGVGGSGPLNDGGRFNPAGNSWTVVPATGAPAKRYSHTAVWTGNEMIIWGGDSNNGLLNDGGRYNPSANTWAAVSTSSAPPARIRHTAVWTGTEMMVWGGSISSDPYISNNGSRYNPAADIWTVVTTTGAPPARNSHTAVWTGSEMIVWGGEHGGIYLNDTWSYTPGQRMLLYQRP